MWVLTADGDALVNLDRVDVVRVEERPDEAVHVLCAEGTGWSAVLDRGSEAEMRARLLTLARQIDADIVGVLDVRTGKGAVA